MAGSKYIPSNNVTFCDWVETASGYAVENHEQWGVEAPDESLAGKLTRLKTLSHLCATSKRTPEDLAERNMLRKEVEREVRSYLQGFIMRNPHVTDRDRTAMGLPLRDTKPTPIGEPAGQADAHISYPGRTQLLLRIRHIDGTPSDARANYGCRIYFGVFALDAPLPEAGKDLPESRFTRIKKELFVFEQADSGKRAVFCIRYENNRGKTGPWGPVFSAIIP